ncbi:hypothetical protein OC846_000697 [Tilletia horrida]|uniref:ditrans,polycis-polyprenyl diphosphate synthase [(2E,6E)-farnesyldiphosphate specific] n=1 Tax=Tilletia horrida TaxID=155126 RepID=A0AAN6JU71_9BASI|nr:hypothetical protein OC846_000697 [Tilletia horrida]
MESVKKERPLQNGYVHELDTSTRRPYSPSPSEESAPASTASASSSPPPSFLRPLHLALFSLIHATYALLLALYDAFEWISPSEAIREARAIGRAIQSSAEPNKNIKTPQMKAPKHLALVLQTPYYDDEVEGAGSEEAERLALEYLRAEVRRVAQWCDQLGVQRLTVMDTDGLLAAATEGGAVEAVLGIEREDKTANGHAASRIGAQKMESSGIEKQAAHLRKRTRTRLRHQNPAEIPAGARHEPHGNASSPTIELMAINLPVELISPFHGDTTFAEVAEDFRVELEHKCRRRAIDAAESPSASGIKVSGTERPREEEAWTRVNRTRDGSPFLGSSSTPSEHELEELETLRGQLVEWIDQMTVPELDKALLEHGHITEPDFMILHGVPRRSVQLGGFPAWSIRLTEIFHDPQADPRRPITLATFVRAIKYFNNTEHRFGK